MSPDIETIFVISGILVNLVTVGQKLRQEPKAKKKKKHQRKPLAKVFMPGQTLDFIIGMFRDVNNRRTHFLFRNQRFVQREHQSR